MNSTKQVMQLRKVTQGLCNKGVFDTMSRYDKWQGIIEVANKLKHVRTFADMSHDRIQQVVRSEVQMYFASQRAQISFKHHALPRKR